MPDVQVFSPRKMTPQNKDHLPSTHDDNIRMSYMRVTLTEDELAAAVRNYITSQIPIDERDEMPVVFVAGRGENGHSAEVTIMAKTPTVQRAETASPAFTGYEEANQTVLERNGQTSQSQAGEEEDPALRPKPVAEPDTEEAVSAVTETQESQEDAPETLMEEVTDQRDEQPQSKTASSLFEDAQAEPEAPAQEEQPAPKKSSIFDNIG